MPGRLLTAVALAFSLAAVSAPVAAQGDITVNYAMVWKMADKNNDGMVTKAEFMEAMGKAFDMHMKKVKGMKEAAEMMKGDALTQKGFRMFMGDIAP